MRTELELFWGFIVGACCGVMMTVVLFNALITPHSEAIDAVYRCELTIPRDQHCIITAVVEEKE